VWVEYHVAESYFYCKICFTKYFLRIFEPLKPQVHFCSHAEIAALLCWIFLWSSLAFQCKAVLSSSDLLLILANLQTVCPAACWPSPQPLVQIVSPAQLLLTCRPSVRPYRPAASSYRPAWTFPVTACGGSVQISWLPGGADRQGQAASGPIHVPFMHCLWKPWSKLASAIKPNKQPLRFQYDRIQYSIWILKILCWPFGVYHR
jgi:hypothetical protein